ARPLDRNVRPGRPGRIRVQRRDSEKSRRLVMAPGASAAHPYDGRVAPYWWVREWTMHVMLREAGSIPIHAPHARWRDWRLLDPAYARGRLPSPVTLPGEDADPIHGPHARPRGRRRSSGRALRWGRLPPARLSGEDANPIHGPHARSDRRA